MIQERLNRTPIGHIQDVCQATLVEFDSLVDAFDSQKSIFNNHARIGLNAIIGLQPGKTSKMEMKRVEKAYNSINPPPVVQKRNKRLITR